MYNTMVLLILNVMVFFCSSERTVTIPRSPNGFGFKMIGGKTVGVFISDIRADVTQVSIKHFDQLYIYLRYYIVIDIRPSFIIILLFYYRYIVVIKSLTSMDITHKD